MLEYLLRWKEIRTTFIVAIIIVLSFYTVYKIITYSFIKDEEVVEIYFADNISPVHKEIINEFNQENKGNIKVIPVDISFYLSTTNERKQLFTRYLRSENKRIDIFSIDQIWIPRFSKWAEPLNSYLTNDLKKIIIPSVLKASEFENHLVAIPQFTDLGLLYYRDDLIRKKSIVGNSLSKNGLISWENLLSDAANIKAFKTLIYQGASYEGLMCMFIEVYLAMGGKYNYNNADLFDREITGSVIEFLREMTYKFKLVADTVASLEENSSYSYFVNNDLYFMRNWSNVGRDMFTDSSSLKKISKIKVAQIPYFQNKVPVTLLGGWYMMISRFSDHKRESFEFIKYWLKKSVQEKIFREGGFVPINTQSYSDSSFVKEYPILKFYEKIFPIVITRPFVPDYTRKSDIMTKYINKVLKGEIETKPAVDMIFKEMNSFVN